MRERVPLLEIRLDGGAIAPGTISVSLLLRFLSNWNEVLHRVGRVLCGDSTSIRDGHSRRRMDAEIGLALVSLKQGSPAAVLGFERQMTGRRPVGTDFGQMILENTLNGLKEIQNGIESRALPTGYDDEVLKAWETTGTVFSNGVTTVSFRLNGSGTKIRVSLSTASLGRIIEKLRGSVVKTETIEGKLLMADFDQSNRRCRVHPSSGDPVSCTFGAEQCDAVRKCLLREVRIKGELETESISGRTSSMRIQSIRPLGNDEACDIASIKERGRFYDFWNPMPLNELVKLQGVKPLTDLSALFGTWPGEIDDGLEEAIDELRHPSSSPYRRS